MAARQAAAQRRRLGDREDRRMRVSPVRYAKRVEPGEQLFGGQRRIRRHAGTMRRAARDYKDGHYRGGRRAGATRTRTRLLANPLPRHDIVRPDAGVAQG